MRMATSFLGLTVEQHWAYATKARAEAPAKLEIAGIAKAAARTARPGELIEMRT